MDESYYKKITGIILLVALLVLSFLLVRPIILAVVGGVILAFIFIPIYNWIHKLVKSKDLAATLVCILLLVLIFLPFWLLIPLFVDQSVKLYSSIQKIDFESPLQSLFPSLFNTERFTEELSSALYNFATKITNSLLEYASNFILNLPTMLIQLAVVLFTFYFTLRDREQIFSYAKSLMPFSKTVEKKIVDYTKGITISVIYGQVIIGFIQGLITGAGFFLFKVPNALLLTLLASLAGILPIIGTAIIWVPVAIYLFAIGSPLTALGVIIFGSISSIADNFLRPIIVSRRSKIHPAILLIGMIGGLFMFGVLGFIIGPLIIAYLLIFLEVYRNREVKGIFIQEEPEPKEEKSS